MDTARAMAKERKIEALVDLDEFTGIAKIEKSLRVDHKVDLALAWCGENKQALKKIDVSLDYFLEGVLLIQFPERTRVSVTTTTVHRTGQNWSARETLGSHTACEEALYRPRTERNRNQKCCSAGLGLRS